MHNTFFYCICVFLWFWSELIQDSSLAIIFFEEKNGLNNGVFFIEYYAAYVWYVGYFKQHHYNTTSFSWPLVHIYVLLLFFFRGASISFSGEMGIEWRVEREFFGGNKVWMMEKKMKKEFYKWTTCPFYSCWVDISIIFSFWFIVYI